MNSFADQMPFLTPN